MSNTAKNVQNVRLCMANREQIYRRMMMTTMARMTASVLLFATTKLKYGQVKCYDLNRKDVAVMEIPAAPAPIQSEKVKRTVTERIYLESTHCI